MSSTPTPVPTLQPPVTTDNALLALQSLHSDPDPVAKRRANEWLSEFQHTVEAWNVCHELVSAQGGDVPMQGRMLGAQTFRSKVTYDLSQLPTSQLIPLRDSFISSLHTYSRSTSPAGSKAIIIQLCLSLADLALQMGDEWKDVIPSMIDAFGKDQEGIPMLLEFLKVLVEESENVRIPLTPEQATERFVVVLSSQSERVLELLSMYMQAPGVTSRIRTACFETLRAWLQTGELSANSVARTPLFNFAFEALKTDDLFDAAVDVVHDIIHETQEVEDNVQVVQMIVPRVIDLRTRLREAWDDMETVKGLCRVFSEAGEIYAALILQHPETFLPIVEVIAECTAYPDPEVPPYTFRFWWQISKSLKERDPEAEDPAYLPLRQVFIKLQDAIIRQLQFPPDDADITPAERDEFRSFRHYLGDTLKDCCEVLGADVCMKRSYELVAQAVNKPGGFVWQEIEAPLFSMRSMGANVDPNDDEILPHIMDILPQLPPHNKIRYAALLVISRYTEWIDQHPSYLEFQLNYISTGFDITDDEVSSAAAQAMKFMCEDCKRHLVPYLPHLYDFITTAALNLPIEDRLEVTEAIAYVISHMPANDAALSLQKFCQPLLEQIQALAAKPTPVSKEEQRPALDAMEQLEAYLLVVRSIEPFPESCRPTAAAIYDVVDQVLAKFYNSYSISDKAGRILRRGMQLFPRDVVLALLPRILGRLTSCYEQSGFAGYLWVMGHAAGLYGAAAREGNLPRGTEAELALSGSWDRCVSQTKQLEDAQGADAIPDVLEDFNQMAYRFVHLMPWVIAQSPALPTAIDLILSSLNLLAPEVVLAGLDVLVEIFKAYSKDPASAHVLAGLVQQYGERIVAQTLTGLISSYPEESNHQVNDLVKGVHHVSPQVAQTAIVQMLQQLPTAMLSAQDKEATMDAFNKAFADGNLRSAVNSYYRAARRMKDRNTRTKLPVV